MIPVRAYWRLLRHYLRPLRLRVGVLTTLLVTGIAFQVINPQLIRAFIDRAMEGATLDALLTLAAGFILLAVAYQVLSVAATYFAEQVGWTATNEMRADLAAHILDLDMSFHKTTTPGELIKRIDGDVTTLSNFFSKFVIHVGGNLVLVIAIVALMWREHPWIGLGMTGFAAAGLFAMVRLQAVAIPWWRSVRGKRAEFFGFLGAGLLKAFLPEEAVARHLGKSSTGAVLKASLFGIPLPLCSCGVIPAAVGLRKQGASKGASAAFLVSTPESGVDSIAVTWALLDPVMTVARPLAAFVTATVTGLLINRLPEETAPVAPEVAPAGGCGCAGGSCAGSATPAQPPLGRRLRNGLAYAFGELLGDIGRWLLLGILVAGVLAWWLPDDFFARQLGGEFSSLLIMLVVGIPLYICASASTPVAAAMVLKGLSPGAALVFLLAGPATNAATITVVTRFWGRRATVAYLAAIAGCSLLFGWLLNRFYAWSSLDITRWVMDFRHEEASLPAVAAALLLLGLIGWQNLRGWRGKKQGGCG